MHIVVISPKTKVMLFKFGLHLHFSYYFVLCTLIIIWCGLFQFLFEKENGQWFCSFFIDEQKMWRGSTGKRSYGNEIRTRRKRSPWSSKGQGRNWKKITWCKPRTGETDNEGQTAHTREGKIATALWGKGNLCKYYFEILYGVMVILP